VLVLGGLLGVAANVSAATSSYHTEVLRDAPMADYQLGDARGSSVAVDSSGFNHPAAAFGGVTFGTPGALVGSSSTAVTLDGANDYLRTPNAFSVGSDFTIEAWVKPGSKSGNYPVVSLWTSSGTRTLDYQGGQFVGMADLSSSWPSYTAFGGGHVDP